MDLDIRPKTVARILNETLTNNRDFTPSSRMPLNGRLYGTVIHNSLVIPVHSDSKPWNRRQRSSIRPAQ